MNWKVFLIFIFGLAMLSAMFKNETVTSTKTPEPNNFEYNYAKNRFKQEGYSDKDSRAAAEAILKFEAAQRNRGR